MTMTLPISPRSVCLAQTDDGSSGVSPSNGEGMYVNIVATLDSCNSHDEESERDAPQQTNQTLRIGSATSLIRHKET